MICFSLANIALNYIEDDFLYHLGSLKYTYLKFVVSFDMFTIMLLFLEILFLQYLSVNPNLQVLNRF